MIIVKPDQEVTQHREDVVVYLLSFKEWDADLERPESKEARISVRALRGDSVNMKVLPYRDGKQAHEVRITGGGRMTRCEIVRMVKARDEIRRKSFIVNIKEL